MAMVKLDGTIEEINGREGGNIWRRDQCGQHIQREPRFTPGPPSKPQTKRRWCFFKCVRFFFTQLTETEQNLWWIWSFDHPIKNKKGETVYMQPHMAFLSINLNRCVKDRALLRIPPFLGIPL